VSAPLAQISYVLTMADIHAFNQHYARTSPVVRAGRLKVRLAMTFFLAALLGALGWGARADVGFWLLGAVIILFWFAIFPRRLEAMQRGFTERTYQAGKNAGLLGPHTVELTDEGVVERTPVRELKVKWEAVEKVASSDEHLFVWTSGFNALVVPRRAFPDEDALKAFAAHAAMRISK
jgi:YcxB-like protein